MNTQTHILMGVAAVVPLTRVVGSLPWPRRTLILVVAAVMGGVLPDATVALMISIGAAQQVPMDVVFGQWYFNDFWQRLGAMTNSIAVFGAIALLAWASLRRGAVAVWLQANEVALVFSVSGLLHALSDLPLHHDDGRPHFWPFTDWVYASPVSYWDSRHYGNIWSMIELAIVTSLAVVLWRSYTHWIARSLVLVAAVSCFGVHQMWRTFF